MSSTTDSSPVSVNAIQDELDLLGPAKSSAKQLKYLFEQKSKDSTRIAAWSKRASWSESELLHRYASRLSNLAVTAMQEGGLARGSPAYTRFHAQKYQEENSPFEAFQRRFATEQDKPELVYKLATQNLEPIEAYVTKYGSEPSVPGFDQSFGMLTLTEMQTIRDELLSQLHEPTTESASGGNTTSVSATTVFALSAAAAAAAFLLAHGGGG